MSPQSAALPRIATPEVEHLDDYVLGYPMHVAITVQLRADDPASVVYGAFPIADVFMIAGVAVKLALASDPSSGRTFGAPAARGSSQRPPGRNDQLVAGERRRMLVDLSDLEITGLQPGTYTVAVTYAGEPARPFDVTLHEPSAAQKAELAQLERERAEAGSWGQWAMYPALGRPHAYDASANPSDQLRLNKVLYYVLHARHAIAPSSVRSLTGIYAQSASVLEAELMLLAGDKKGYSDFASKLRASHPETSYALDALDRGESLLATIRANTEAMEKGLP